MPPAIVRPDVLKMNRLDCLSISLVPIAIGFEKLISTWARSPFLKNLNKSNHNMTVHSHEQVHKHILAL